MMSKENGKSLNDESLYINNSLGLLFDFFKAKLKLSTSNYRLYGHSGGSQFVHRYLLLSNDTRIEKAAMANAGFYTFLDDEITYPFGTKKMKISDERIKWFYRLKGGVFLGSADNDSNHESLPRMRKARIDLKEVKIFLMIWLNMELIIIYHSGGDFKLFLMLDIATLE